MKRLYIASGLIILVAALSSFADNQRLNDHRPLIGRISVGDNRGTACRLTFLQTRNDIYSTRYEVKFSQHKYRDKKWVIESEEFSLQNYGGQYEGSRQKMDVRTGSMKKITIQVFMDPRSQNSYKAIRNENNLPLDGSVGKYTVCDGMIVNKIDNK